MFKDKFRTHLPGGSDAAPFEIPKAGVGSVPSGDAIEAAVDKAKPSFFDRFRNID